MILLCDDLRISLVIIQTVALLAGNHHIMIYLLINHAILSDNGYLRYHVN